MNHERIRRLSNELRSLERDIAKEQGLSIAQYNIAKYGWDRPSLAIKAKQQLQDRLAANRAGFLTVKAWKHAKGLK